MNSLWAVNKKMKVHCKSRLRSCLWIETRASLTAASIYLLIIIITTAIKNQTSYDPGGDEELATSATEHSNAGTSEKKDRSRAESAGTLRPSPEPEPATIDCWARGWVASRGTHTRDWVRLSDTEEMLGRTKALTGGPVGGRGGWARGTGDGGVTDGKYFVTFA